MPRRSSFLIVETHSIAKSFIEALELRRSNELEKLRCYASDRILLAESRAQATGGDSALAAAVTVSYLLGKIGHDAATRLLYVGECTARPSSAEAFGRIVLANRVSDNGSGRSYYPDILIAHEFLEGSIETARGELPLDHRLDGPGFVDRELSGIIAAALTFLAPHQVYCLAAVTGVVEAPIGLPDAAPSGDRTPSSAGRREPGEIISGEMGAILRLLEESAHLVRPAGAELSDAARNAVEELAGQMRLTAAQSVQLRTLVKAAAAHGRDVEEILAHGRRPVRTKQERNRGFDELKQLLAP